MKRTIILALMLINVSVFAQSPIVDKLTARQKITSPIYFKSNGDTLISKLDTATSGITGSFSRYNYSKLLNIKSSPWDKLANDIYYNTGKVFIGQTSGTNTLDVNGLIGSSNIFEDTVNNIISLGYMAGRSGNCNIFIGRNSGYSNIDGSGNIFQGSYSGYSNTSGSNNIFQGYNSGFSNTTGYNNIFQGSYSGHSNTDGYNNIFQGSYSGYSNTSGSNNIFQGYNSGFSNTDGYNNIFQGPYSGHYNTYGSGNIFQGYNSGYSNTSGSNNIFQGYNSGFSNTTGYNNIFQGSYSGHYNTDGSDNIFQGDNSGYSNTVGSSNIFQGSYSGDSNTVGSSNIFQGSYSGYSNTSGSNNIFQGYNSGFSNTTGSNNILIGSNARYYREASNNELVIDALIRGDNLNDSLIYQKNSLIVGKFDADTLNQSVDINGRLRYTGTFAEIYRHKDSTAYIQAIPSGATPTKILAFSDNGYNSHCTSDVANDRIIITKAGYYDVTLYLSYSSGTNNLDWTAYVFLNDVAVPNINSTGNSSSLNTYRSTGLGGRIHVSSVPSYLDYRVSHNYGSSVNISYKYVNLKVNYNGE